MDDTVPSTPDPQMTALVAMLLRYLFAGLGAAGLVHGSVSGVPWEAIAGPVVMIGTLAWAIVERVRLAQHTHEVAIASANARQPVQPS